MNAGMMVVAAALAVWPASIASGRLAELDGDQAGGPGQTRWSVGVRELLGRAPAAVVFPLAAGAVALLAAGPLHACAAVVLGGTVADLRARAGERRRRLAGLGAWERALDDASSALRAGAGPGTALQRAADGAAAADPAVAAVLTSAASHARLGGDIAAALRASVDAGWPGRDARGRGRGRGRDRVGDRAGDRVAGELAGAWLLATRHGVVLADAVDGLRADVASRRERALRVDATLAGPRATAVILTALPGFGVLLGSGFGADPLSVLLTGTLGGALCLAGSVFLAAGLLWTDRIAGGAS